ncbi:MAG: MFS transporter [Spirochaetales bacterium]|nr:MFS transporter [Spirochaetales bacterium]
MKNISKFEYGVYASGIAGQNILYNFMSMYIMFFFTDLLGIASKTATMIVVAASLWDAVNDPAMGLIADKTRTKFGKFRPYLFGGSVLILITTTLCYSNFNVAPKIAIAIAAATYILWGMSFTVSDIPIWALSSVASDEPNERNKMIAVGKIGATIGVVICVLLSVKLLGLFGGERNIDAYFYAAMIVGFIAALGIFLTGVFVKERIEPAKQRVSIRENIRTVTKNKSLMFLVISLFMLNLINSIRQVSQMYFTVYTWGSADYVTSIGISLIIGMLIGISMTPKLIEKFEKKHILFAACLSGAAVSLIPYFALSNVLLGLISLGLSFTTIGVMIITSTSMLIDAIDYSEWKLGFRGEGIVFSLNTFVTKLGAAFARLVLGFGLIAINYTENQPITDSTIACFSALIYLVPAIFCILTIIPLMFYKIDNKTIGQIENELRQRRVH